MIFIVAWFTVLPIGVFLFFVGPEVLHRHDSAWTYGRVTFSDCTYKSEDRDSYNWSCDIDSDPVSDIVAAGVRVTAYSDTRDHGPGYGYRWLHRTDGAIDGAARKHSYLWSLVLILPALLDGAVILDVRKAHRLGYRWLDPALNNRRRLRRRPAPGDAGSATPTSF